MLLATGDRNGGLFVWEAPTGREYFALRGHTATITDVSWRDDSNVLASASEDTTIKLWEMENGGKIKNWGAHGGGAQSVQFAHDGRLVSTGRDRVTKLWDQNGAVQKQFEALPDIGLRAVVTHDNAKVVRRRLVRALEGLDGGGREGSGDGGQQPAARGRAVATGPTSRRRDRGETQTND